MRSITRLDELCREVRSLGIAMLVGRCSDHNWALAASRILCDRCGSRHKVYPLLLHVIDDVMLRQIYTPRDSTLAVYAIGRLTKSKRKK